jgi:hypothetical protein
MNNNKSIRWLHVSDFHFGKDDYGQRKLSKYLLENVKKNVLALKQAMVEYRIVIRGRAAAIGWQVSARAMFEVCVVA